MTGIWSEPAGRRGRLRRAVVVVVVASLAAALAPPTSQAQSVPAVSKAVVQESPDYWTETLADPLDYANREDEPPDPAHGNVRPRREGGALRWTKTTTMNVGLLFAGYAPSAFAIGREGLANPVDAARYTHLSLRLYAERGGAAEIFWDNCGPDAGRCTNRVGFTLQPGWRHYTIDLRPGGWSGRPVEIRLAVAGDGTPTTMALDWARLYQPGERVTVSYTGGTLHWDADADRANNRPDEPGWGVLHTGGGTATFPADAFPAGEYRFYADSGPSSAPLLVDAPVPVFSAPHERGGADYAATVTGDAWDFRQPTDIAEIGNATDVRFENGTLHARNTSGDPYLVLRTGAPIDTARFHRLTVRTTLEGPFDLSFSPGGGSHGRFLWRHVGQGPTPFLYDSREIVVYPGVETYTLDLHTKPPEAISPAGSPHRSGWVGAVERFRYDPNEDPGPRRWTVSEISLRADHETVDDAFPVVWRDTSAGRDRPTRVSLYYTPVRGATDGQLIAAGLRQAPGENTYRWDTSGVPSGRYWVYAVAERDNGTVGRRFASGPLRVTGTYRDPLIARACPPEAIPPAGFTDVSPANLHAGAISCTVAYGLARGLGPTTYGPAAGVRRDQMASFVGRLLEEAGVVLEASGSHFTDTAGNVHADRIDALAQAGIVVGVRPGEYGPRARVTRDQMASFLVRAYELAAARGLPAPAHGFGDVAGNVHEPAIAKAAAAGFAVGVSPNAYGPRRPVRRDQMASFLARVLSRLVEDGIVDARG
ncbi:MAG TPA: S-layer homology domain-containing protein [Egibacteraceae bacterium]|jgi:hypothetical protein|nr:S-layer homology domain-containing protein [Egibacteraceae bacterium]